MDVPERLGDDFLEFRVVDEDLRFRLVDEQGDFAAGEAVVEIYVKTNSAEFSRACMTTSSLVTPRAMSDEASLLASSLSVLYVQVRFVRGQMRAGSFPLRKTLRMKPFR